MQQVVSQNKILDWLHDSKEKRRSYWERRFCFCTIE